MHGGDDFGGRFRGIEDDTMYDCNVCGVNDGGDRLLIGLKILDTRTVAPLPVSSRHIFEHFRIQHAVLPRADKSSVFLRHAIMCKHSTRGSSAFLRLVRAHLMSTNSNTLRHTASPCASPGLAGCATARSASPNSARSPRRRCVAADSRVHGSRSHRCALAFLKVQIRS